MASLPRRGRRVAVLAILLVGVAPAGRPFAQAPDAAPRPAPAAAEKDRHPELRRLSPTEEVWIDRDRKEVVVGGVVALDDGPIEVFACPEKTKEHEAVVAARSSARLIHAALLAIGLEPGSPVRFRPDYEPARGPAVAVRMRWTDEAGAVQECRAQEWVRDARTGAPLAAEWVFAGSGWWHDPRDGTASYLADAGELVCVSNFSTAMLDLPIESSQANDALLFEAFAERVPPTGTPVEMILSAAP
jgi:hypothetical protein